MDADRPLEPRRVAIAPFDCLARAGRLVEGDYWLLVGISTVGILIASFVPFGLLAAPMYAGIYMAFRAKERGRPVAFEQLFSRFDTFVQGLIATLVYLGVVLVVTLPVYLVAGFSIVGGAAAMEEHNKGLGIALFCVAGLGYLVAIVLAFAAQVAFTFTYAILAEHAVDGLTALRLSARAARMNFWGVLGLVLLVALISLVSAFLCLLPIVFLMPFLVGAAWIAYRKVFGEPPPGALPGEPADDAPSPTVA